MERRRSSFDNTEVVLTFSKQEREGGAVYWRCLPDFPIELSLLLSECHLIFDQESGELRISRNRNTT